VRDFATHLECTALSLFQCSFRNLRQGTRCHSQRTHRCSAQPSPPILCTLKANLCRAGILKQSKTLGVLTCIGKLENSGQSLARPASGSDRVFIPSPEYTMATTRAALKEEQDSQPQPDRGAKTACKLEPKGGPCPAGAG